MSANGISTEVVGDGSDPIATKLKRREDKLDLAAIKRATVGSNGYRPLNILGNVHTAYVNGVNGAILTDNIPGTASPTVSHPWTLDPNWDNTSGIGAGAEVTGLIAGTITFLEMDGGLNDSGDLEDSTATFTTNGFVLNNAATNGSAVVLRNLSTANDSFFDTSAYNSGYVWTVTWASGSTYASTPVAMYYELFGAETVTFWILDPSDGTYNTPINAGTFKFPAVFTPGTTATSFTN